MITKMNKKDFFYFCNKCKTIFVVMTENYNDVKCCPACGLLDLLVFDSDGKILGGIGRA